MSTNSHPNPPQTRANCAFAIGLLLGIVIALLTTRPTARSSAEQMRRNAETLKSVYDEVFGDE